MLENNEESILDHFLIKYIHQSKSNEIPRNYLGCSVLGKRCQREVYFHSLFINPEISPTLACIFEEGHVQEEVIIKHLTEAGAIITDQQREVIALDGYIKGHIDGIIQYYVDGPKRLLEIKTASDISFKKYLEMKSLKEYKPEYYYQIQLYLHFLGLYECELRVKNKSTGMVYLFIIGYCAEDVNYILNFAQQLKDGFIPPKPDFVAFREEYNNNLINKYNIRVSEFNAGLTKLKRSPSQPKLIQDGEDKYCEYCNMKPYCTNTKQTKEICKTPCDENCRFCNKFIPKDGIYK